jgi:hypothetical protein
MFVSVVAIKPAQPAGLAPLITRTAGTCCCLLQFPPTWAKVWKAATSKADPTQKQDWFLKCLRGSLGTHLCYASAR